jgi:hypothetical protein
VRLSTTRDCSQSPATTHRVHSILRKARPVSARVERGLNPSMSRDTPRTIARRACRGRERERSERTTM